MGVLGDVVDHPELLKVCKTDIKAIIGFLDDCGNAR